MIIFAHKNPLADLPPVISLLRVLKDLGEKVVYLGLVETETTRQILDEIGIEYKLNPYCIVPFRRAPFYRIWQKITQVLRPYLFRRWLWRQVPSRSADLVLWSAEMDVAAILGDRARQFGRRHICSLYELGDERGRGLLGFDMSRLYKEATLIECEYNRAWVVRAENDIGRLPFVIPNKPYGHPRKRKLEVSDAAAAAAVAEWHGRRVFLYQGTLQNDRGELTVLIESFCRLFPDCTVAVMGRKTDKVAEFEKRYPNFSYVPFVRAPHHLEVTSHADFGIAYYKAGVVHGLSPLNPVYCAPNKIYEYAGFGLPVICNDIPGLRYTIGQNQTGKCLVDFSDEGIKNEIGALMEDYQKYSDNAERFFDAFDLKKMVGDILDYARSGK